MSYVDQRMGSGRVTSLIVVAILHALIGYAMVTGMAFKVIKKAAEDLKTFDVTEEAPPPPEEPPPPPEKIEVEPPPVVAPPPIVQRNLPPPPITTQPVAPPPPPMPVPVAAPPPPPPPPPPKKVEPAKARANLASYISDADYPDAALRNEEQGTTGFTLEVGSNGRVTNCTITSSSGSATLDNATCRIMRSRARFSPARDSSGSATNDTVSARIRWVLPE